MKVFNPRHFLRHISMPTLREFVEASVLAPRLRIDWTEAEEILPGGVCDSIDALGASANATDLKPDARRALLQDLHHWFEDLRRAHLMSNELAIAEFLSVCSGDSEVIEAFSTRDVREKSLWMLTHRDKAFRDAELHLAFLAKTNGKYWKKFRIQLGLDPTRDRAKIETFANEVARLYKKDGCGESTHIEMAHHVADGTIQLVLYVEGPITALAHFTDNHFQRITTRIALETAVVYQPATGVVETVVKGGSKAHSAVLQLFGRYVVEAEIEPQEIVKTRYRLNELRDGLMAPTDDWSKHGVEKVRLRRAQFAPMNNTGVAYHVEASPDKTRPDAIYLAREALKVSHSFEVEYDLVGATVIVYTFTGAGRRAPHFSFDIFASGSSTIKNLSSRNQPVALAVLRALNVIDAEEPGS